MFSVYIHVPFCLRRCHYCDFITYADQLDFLPDYVEAAAQEIRQLGLAAGSSAAAADTVYFGGGTPSLMEPMLVARLLEELSRAFGIAPSAEISLEANPGTLHPTKLKALRAEGVNRLSLGVQSFSDEELRLLGRIHSRQQAEESIRWARGAGFEQLNLDLISGLPRQTLEEWRENLLAAVSFRPEHLSVYSLIVEEGTLLERQIASGALPEPDEDLAADMYELTQELLAQAGYTQYEISNWALTENCQSRHNTAYWKTTPYVGIGAAAHSFAGSYRTENVRGIQDYIKRIRQWEPDLQFPFSPANLNRTKLEPFTQMQESMLLGLRLTHEGISLSEFERRFGRDAREVFTAEIMRLQKKQLVEFAQFADGPHLRLTRRGVLVGNQAFMEFV
ncbi:MAG: radical SAM family heme chaperone HemW [Anaerolineaceae bacterium]